MGRHRANRNQLFLRDHLREIEVGAFESERGHTQKVLFNVVLDLEDGAFDLDDDVDRILSYEVIVDAVDEVLKRGRSDLLETMAEQIATVLFRDDRIMSAEIRIEKLDLVSGSLGVRIFRSRDGEAPRDVSSSEGILPAVPGIYFCPNEVALGDDLAVWIDAIHAIEPESIICVEGRQDSGPLPQDPGARLRMELLSIDQNAWYLASRDKRIGVATTHAELKARTSEGRLSVWAPSRMTLGAGAQCMDAQDSSEHGLALALAIWLAGEFGAEVVVACGQEEPFSRSMPDPPAVRILCVESPDVL